jgi:hypothetical protein
MVLRAHEEAGKLEALRDLEGDIDLAGEPLIAVILPCYNEGKTIARVVEDFRRYLPSAAIPISTARSGLPRKCRRRPSETIRPSSNFGSAMKTS